MRFTLQGPSGIPPDYIQYMELSEKMKLGDYRPLVWG